MNAEKTNANGNGCAADTKGNDDNSDGGGGGDSETIAANGPNANDSKRPTAASTATAISTDVSLPNEVLERLFQRYSIKQRRAGLECFLVTSVLFDLWVIFVPQPGHSFERIGMLCKLCLFIYILVLFVCVPLCCFSNITMDIILVHFTSYTNVLRDEEKRTFSEFKSANTNCD